jgi:hypothetical protein
MAHDQQARCARLPDKITPIFLPSGAPELNPGENVWQYLRQNWLSNTVYENYEAIVDAACEPWCKLIADPERSHTSECETGPTSVNRYDLQDETDRWRGFRRRLLEWFHLSEPNRRKGHYGAAVRTATQCEVEPARGQGV